MKTMQKHYLKNQNLCSVIKVLVSTDVCLNISESCIYLRGFIVEKKSGFNQSIHITTFCGRKIPSYLRGVCVKTIQYYAKLAG